MFTRVVGPPGCGKTTWLSRQVRRAWEADHRVLVCSLTNAAAQEVAGRDLPLDSQCIGTLHAHAYRSIRAGKLEIVNDHLPEWNEHRPSMALSGGRVMDEDNAAPWGQEIDGDLLLQDYHNQRARMIPRTAWKGSTLAFAKEWEAWKANQGYWDFTDLIATSLSSVDAAPGDPDVIFADEAQDFSRLEMALLQKWGDAAGQLIVVGDPWQSLYEWRGADAGAIFPPEELTHIRDLEQSYRLPQAVHAAAMTLIQRMPGWYPIEYRPTVEAGSVHRCGATYAQPELAADVITAALAKGQTVMYLAATGRMLGPMLKVLRQRGVPFSNRWRLREGSWNPLQEHKNKVSSARRLAAFLRLGTEGIWSKADVLTWAASMKGFQPLKKMLDGLPGDTVDFGIWETLAGLEAVEASMTADLGWYLDHQLAARRPAAEYLCAIVRRSGSQTLNEVPSVTVGTIHSVKGGEADVVLVAPDISVPGLAEWHSGDRGKAAIYRLFYVAITRARQELHILRPERVGQSVRLI